MLIGEFAKQAGITADTVRYYEKVGFFSRSRRENGYRVYTDADVETAHLIAMGKSIGFSLREILAFSREMTSGSLDHSRVQHSLLERIGSIDARIASLKTARRLVQEQLAYCREVEARKNSGTPQT